MSEIIENLSKENVLKILHENVCEVIFVKTDGTERKMLASLKKEDIEKKPPLGTGSGKPQPEDLVRCIDTEINDWRSFNLSRVKSLKKIG